MAFIIITIIILAATKLVTIQGESLPGTEKLLRNLLLTFPKLTVSLTKAFTGSLCNGLELRKG